MILVDSSGWLEYFTEGALAEQYERHLRVPSRVLTPTIVVYEVYKRLRRDVGEERALIAAAAMEKSTIVPLTEDLALAAADLSLQHRLAMADAIVLATARQHEAAIFTSDEDFAGIPGVTVLSKKPASRR